MSGGEYRSNMTVLRKSPQHRQSNSTRAPESHRNYRGHGESHVRSPPSAPRRPDSDRKDSTGRHVKSSTKPAPRPLLLKETVAGIVFSGDNCFLSNLFPIRIDHEGRIFDSGEQLFNWIMAKALNDDALADRIFLAPTAIEAYNLTAHLHHKPAWKKERIGAMKFTLSRKFRQNKKYKHRLRKTGTIPLIESGTDPFWSSNASYTDDCYDSDSYPGANMIGVLLDTLRDQFRAEYRLAVEAGKPDQRGDPTDETDVTSYVDGDSGETEDPNVSDTNLSADSITF